MTIAAAAPQNPLQELEPSDSAPRSYYHAKSDPTGSNLRMTDENIRAAVKEWCLPTSREAAMRIYGHISEWNTSSVTDCTMLFKDQMEFNDDISRWDVSNVKSMVAMFCGTNTFNQPIGGWDVSKVEGMQKISVGLKLLINRSVDGISPRWRTWRKCSVVLEHSTSPPGGGHLRLRK